MTKREFLKELEDRLQMLDEKERKDMIEEYTQHISMCMKSGMKEEEAIEDFGDMDDLIAEILEAEKQELQIYCQKIFSRKKRR